MKTCKDKVKPAFKVNCNVESEDIADLIEDGLTTEREIESKLAPIIAKISGDFYKGYQPGVSLSHAVITAHIDESLIIGEGYDEILEVEFTIDLSDIGDISELSEIRKGMEDILKGLTVSELNELREEIAEKELSELRGSELNKIRRELTLRKMSGVIK